MRQHAGHAWLQAPPGLRVLNRSLTSLIQGEVIQRGPSWDRTVLHGITSDAEVISRSLTKQSVWVGVKHRKLKYIPGLSVAELVI